MNQTPSMRGKQFLSHPEISRIFEVEASLFERILRSEIYPIVDEQCTLLRDPGEHVKATKLPAPMRRNKCMDIAQNREWMHPIIGVSQTAVVCHLLQGCRFGLSVREENYIPNLAKQAVDNFYQAQGDQGLRRLSFALEAVESVRTERILRALGLFTQNHTKVQQISLGSGSGNKDLEGMYSQAWIQKGDVFNPDIASFNVKHRSASHTVLVDLDPVYADRYAALNNEHSDRVLALNTDADSALDIVAEKTERQELKKRNVVVAFRMDPVMIPDVKGFFKSVKRVTDDVSDFIMSVGSGNNATEFGARRRKMEEIRRYLGERGLEVFTIKLCTGKTDQERLMNPLFGCSSFATYEIIYCKLKNKKLA